MRVDIANSKSPSALIWGGIARTIALYLSYAVFILLKHKFGEEAGKGFLKRVKRDAGMRR